MHEAPAHVALLAIHSTLHLWYSQYSFDIGIKLGLMETAAIDATEFKARAQFITISQIYQALTEHYWLILNILTSVKYIFLAYLVKILLNWVNFSKVN